MRGTQRVSAPVQAVSFLLALLAAPAVLAAAPAAADPKSGDPIRLDTIQEETVRLILLDVKVEDGRGLPLRGLGREDFELLLDGKAWPVYSADELCTAPPAGSPAPGAAASMEAALAPSEGERDPAGREIHADRRAEPRRFVLYFDFSSLMLDGRLRARRAARHWVREIRRPGEVVEVAAYAGGAGIRILQAWTADSARILAGVERAFSDRELHDPQPLTMFSRVDECIHCAKEALTRCPQCPAYAREDYHHGKRSLLALKHYLAMLGETPGSKTLFLFTQTMSISPGRLYPVQDPDLSIGTHLRLMEQVAAVATESRTALHSFTSGNNQFEDNDLTAVPGMTRDSVEFASNMAEFTGGGYSRGPSDTVRALREAGRESACTYRLAFRPPGGDRKRTRTWRAVVRAGGRRLPWVYRVHHLSEADRAMRRARALLAGAARDHSLDVAATLQPLEAGRSRWSATVQVALQAASLERLDARGTRLTHLDVGALLEDVDRGKTWELLGATRIRWVPGASGAGVLLHEHVIENLRPGRYRLRAFVHDETMDRSGRGEASMTLPHPRRGGMTRPVAFMPGRTVFASGLPLRGDARQVAGRAVRARVGAAPLGEGEIAPGEPLQMTTWVCRPGHQVRSRLVRYIEWNGEPLYQLPLGWVDPAGRCARVTDIFHTIDLEPGVYTYRTGWIEEEGGVEARHVSRPVAFRVGEPRGGPAPVTQASR